jgi:hypothetical protein
LVWTVGALWTSPGDGQISPEEITAALADPKFQMPQAENPGSLHGHRKISELVTLQ